MVRTHAITFVATAVAGFFASLVVACAPVTSAAQASLGPTRADIGHDLARRLCAGCHQVERAGESPNSGSPTFTVLAGRYSQVTLGKKLDDIALGHYQMPPTHVTNDEIDSLVEYLESFRDDWPKPER